MRSLFLSLTFICLSSLAGVNAVSADQSPFSGKTISFIVPNPPGGGNDFLARLLGPLLTERLPGQPAVVVHNVPGASGIIAGNRFARTAELGDLALMVGAPLQIDPLNYRRPQAKYDPTEFKFLGGFTLGGGALIISKTAEKRLYDRASPPVTMGSLAGRTRTNMIIAAWGAEFLGWNIKWVSGYKGADDLLLALQRGEIDMTVVDSLFLIEQLMKTGDFAVLVQTGLLKSGRVVGRPALGDAPLISELVKDKIKTEVGRQAFSYWLNLRTVEKWIAASPGTAREAVDAYRSAFETIVRSKEFLEPAGKLSDNLEVIAHQEVRKRVEELAATPPEATDYVFEMLRRQGLKVK